MQDGARANAPMKVAILGCGYVADFYMATLADYPQLQVVGAYDIDPQRTQMFCAYYKTKPYAKFEELLADGSVDMVLNLTNPRAHFETTSACLQAGKHVYSEKPLAMDSDSAGQLVRLAKDKGLGLATAPCSSLGETAQTLWKALRDDLVGPVRLVYATFDDGMIHRMNPSRWKSVSGAPWPVKDEFEIGCTYEHAAYVLSWLAAYFGPARRVHAYASVRVPDKGVAVDQMAPDFSVGCIEYDNGIVARVTCSIVAPLDKSITIIGERGHLHTKYVRNDGSPVYIAATPPNRYMAGIATRLGHWRVKVEQMLRLPFSISGLRIEKKVPYARKPKFKNSAGAKPVDFMRGPAELAAALREGRACRLSPELGWHMVELIETLQYPQRFEMPRTLKTSFEPIQPLPWN
jgi:predicted dehydrogenase